MKVFSVLLSTVSSEIYQMKYSQCDKVIGYWSNWGEWSSGCFCKVRKILLSKYKTEIFCLVQKNYEVTRYGERYVKERTRQCFCGMDNKLDGNFKPLSKANKTYSGCDTWCGRPHDFIDEQRCNEELILSEWSQWSACLGSQRKVRFNELQIFRPFLKEYCS